MQLRHCISKTASIPIQTDVKFMIGAMRPVAGLLHCQQWYIALPRSQSTQYGSGEILVIAEAGARALR